MRTACATRSWLPLPGLAISFWSIVVVRRQRPNIVDRDLDQFMRLHVLELDAGIAPAWGAIPACGIRPSVLALDDCRAVAAVPRG